MPATSNRFLNWILLWGVFALAMQNASASAAPKVYRDHVDPHWIRGGPDFWYINQLPGGASEFVRVDCRSGTRKPVSSGEIASLDPQQEGGGAAAEVSLHPSVNSDQPTSVNFVNPTAADAQLFWIDQHGSHISYGIVPAKKNREIETYVGHVWLIADSKGAPIDVFEAQEDPSTAVIKPGNPAPAKEPPARHRSPGVSPNHQWEAFVQDNNLWVRDLRNGRLIQLTRDGSADDTYHKDVSRDRGVDMQYDQPDAPPEMAEVYWSPDSQHLVATKTHCVAEHRVYIVQSSPEDQLQPKLVSYPYFKAGDPIPTSFPHLFDLKTEREVTIDPSICPTPWQVSDVNWSPDSSRFTFLYLQRGYQSEKMFSVAAGDGRVTTLVNEQSKTFIDYAGKTYYEFLDDSHELIWMSERDGWNHLYLYDSITGRVKNQITTGPWVVRGVDWVDTQKRQIWFHACGVYPDQNPYYIHFGRVNFDGTGLVFLTQANGTHSVVFSPDKSFYIDTWSRVDLPPVTELHRSSDGKAVCSLETADITELLASSWQAPIPFSAKGRDGKTDIWGVINRPAHWDASKKYPVLEDVYAGPHDSFAPIEFSRYGSDRSFTGHGFVVVQADGMGTSNRSRAFHDVCWKNLDDAGFPDRILWIKAAAARFPWMDLSRVGIFGTSAGGQSALLALEMHGDFYKAAVADCGCYDNRMDKIWWSEAWMGWPVGPQYAEQSCVTRAPDLQGKLLLIGCEMDHNVDPATTMQVVNALIKADKVFEMLIFPNADHGGDGTYGMRRKVDFFSRNLMN